MILGCETPLFSSKKFKAKDFPISLHTYWEYERIDSARLTVDTVRATIVEEGVSIAGKEDLWKIDWTNKHGDVINTHYAQKNEDSLVFYAHIATNGVLRFDAQYHFPFRLEDEWVINKGIGTYQVIDEDVTRSDYGEGFMVLRIANPGITYTLDSTLVIKDIGIVWRSLFIATRRYEIYRLINYNIE